VSSTSAVVRRRISGATVVAVVAGCGLLLVRPVLRNGPAPRASLAAVYLVLLVAGVLLRPRTGRLFPMRHAVPALAIGVGAFALGRIVAGGRPPLWVGEAVVLDVFAAVAEEAFFRRFVYDALLPAGDAAAGAGAAVLFALVHVAVYGWWVVPLDLAAGLVLSWQRSYTGSWGVPAVTHVAANMLMRL
jgi:membrane protease YdiL (CAAX protease family)